VPTYTNIPKSRHYGFETALGVQLAHGLLASDGRDGLDMRVAYTYARYRFVSDTAYQDNEIPGAPRHMVNAELRYRHPVGLTITPRVDWVPQLYAVNNANTAFNYSWLALGLRAEWMIGATRLTAFGEARNLANERYSGSVQVNDANSRYYEPADSRAFYAGLRYQY